MLPTDYMATRTIAAPRQIAEPVKVIANVTGVPSVELPLPLLPEEPPDELEEVAAELVVVASESLPVEVGLRLPRLEEITPKSEEADAEPYCETNSAESSLRKEGSAVKEVYRLEKTGF